MTAAAAVRAGDLSVHAIAGVTAVRRVLRARLNAAAASICHRIGHPAVWRARVDAEISKHLLAAHWCHEDEAERQGERYGAAAHI
jgi:hypothetical protein